MMQICNIQKNHRLTNAIDDYRMCMIMSPSAKAITNRDGGRSKSSLSK